MIISAGNSESSSRKGPASKVLYITSYNQLLLLELEPIRENFEYLLFCLLNPVPTGSCDGDAVLRTEGCSQTGVCDAVLINRRL